MHKTIKIFLLITLLGISFSCEDEGAAPIISCGVVNPAKNLPWLKTMIESWKSNDLYKYMYVSQGQYLGETVFLIGSCCPFCDFGFPVYNCDGNVVSLGQQIQVVDLKIIWKPLNSQCHL